MRGNLENGKHLLQNQVARMFRLLFYSIAVTTEIDGMFRQITTHLHDDQKVFFVFRGTQSVKSNNTIRRLFLSKSRYFCIAESGRRICCKPARRQKSSTRASLWMTLSNNIQASKDALKRILSLLAVLINADFILTKCF